MMPANIVTKVCQLMFLNTTLCSEAARVVTIAQLVWVTTTKIALNEYSADTN